MIKRLSAQVWKGGRRRWFTLDAAVRSEALMLIRDAEKAGDITSIDNRDWAAVLTAVMAAVKAGESPTGDQIGVMVATAQRERLAREPELS